MRDLDYLLIAFLIGCLAAVLTFSPKASAEPWDTGDKVLGVAAVTTLVIDWGQTRYIAKHPDKYREKNKILGEHPSVGRVNTYFVCYIAGTLLVADWFSPNNRKGFLMGLTIVEFSVTQKNKSIGVKWEF